MISFECTKEESILIKACVKRFSDSINNMDLESVDEVRYGLTTINANGTPLDFNRLLNFDLFNFFHDIKGINNNLNRTTGKLENCFLPRCVK